MQRTPEEEKKKGNGTEDIEIRGRCGPLCADRVDSLKNVQEDSSWAWLPIGQRTYVPTWGQFQCVLCCGYNQAHCEENLSTVEWESQNEWIRTKWCANGEGYPTRGYQIPYLFCGIVGGVRDFFEHDLAVTLYQKNAVRKSRNTYDVWRKVPDEGSHGGLTRVLFWVLGPLRKSSGSVVQP